MMMSDQDRSRIEAVADARGVSMARLFQESALSESYDGRERLAIIATLNRQELVRGRRSVRCETFARNSARC